MKFNKPTIKLLKYIEEINSSILEEVNKRMLEGESFEQALLAELNNLKRSYYYESRQAGEDKSTARSYLRDAKRIQRAIKRGLFTTT